VKRPVLIIGWIPRIVMAIARSLHGHGIPVDVADFVTRPFYSRAIRKRFKLPHPSTHGDAFRSELRRVITDGGHDLLIPADDQALAATIQSYDDLVDLVTVACPPPDITTRVLNKALTLETAKRCGIPVPKSVIIHNSSELHDLRNQIPFPWILKPAEKQLQEEEIKSCRLNSTDDIATRFPDAQAFAPPMLLQEYCAGVGVGVELLMHEGECVAVFEHRRLKELPFTGGMAVAAISEAPDAVLVKYSRSLLRALQWDGVAMVEFRVNPVDGRAALMEVNGRYWGTLSLPVMAGIDFPLYQWQVLHGENPLVPCYPSGLRWRWSVGYLVRLHGIIVAAMKSRAAQKLLWTELAAAPYDFSFKTRDPEFNFLDPLPVFISLGRTMKAIASRDLSAVFRHFPAGRILRRSIKVAGTVSGN
jgi:predicted ATP-grasp superfamily ATP-dependent carboligase